LHKVILIIIACFVLAGCQSVVTVSSDVEKEQFQVVQEYLENSAAGNWPEVYRILSGEALAEAKANAGRVKAKEKIISMDLQKAPVCEGIAEVSADIVKNTDRGLDRTAYDFRLIYYGNGWHIYKTAYGDYHHGRLKKGRLPEDAVETIREYVEMPFGERRTAGLAYLAGKLRASCEKVETMPVDTKTAREQENMSTRLVDTECLGLSDNYLVVMAGLEVFRENKAIPVCSLLDMALVGSEWKICRLDIVR